MTTTPQEPLNDPDVVPSGDPSPLTIPDPDAPDAPDAEPASDPF